MLRTCVMFDTSQSHDVTHKLFSRGFGLMSAHDNDFKAESAAPAALPVSSEAGFDVAKRDAESRKIEAALRAESARCIVGDSAPMRNIFNLIRKFAVSDAPVLITGETGTGKELVAAAIHGRSPRASGPFKVVNCAAIPSSLIGSELFGHEKGAFTGAVTRKKGIIEAANGGTLLLDEIGHLPLELQGYLLRFLQESTIQPIGGIDPVPVDVRIIAATNVDFPALISSGQFRNDLFFRLNVLTIHTPPLRARGDDVLILAHFFLRKFAAEHGRPTLTFTPAAERRLVAHTWPGNIRELMACIQRAVVVCDADQVDADDMQMVDLGTPEPTASRPEPPAPLARPRPRGARDSGQERQRLVETIQDCDGNLTQAAAMLQISRMTMYRLLRRHGIGSEVTTIRNDARVGSSIRP